MSSLESNGQRIAEIGLEHFKAGGGKRVLIAVVGAPGSGKSTLAERAVELINEKQAASAALFPMDGYHYDDVVLDAMGRRAFKGALDTFDAHGFRHMLQRLKANEDDVVAVPVFDRSIEIARAGGRLVPRSVDIVVCEGNYLLMADKPWNLLKPIFDFTIFVDVDVADLRRRLQERWRSLGLDEAEIGRKVEENDLPNGLAIISNSAEPDLRLKNSG